MSRLLGLFQHAVRSSMSRHPVPQRRDFFAWGSAEPKKRTKRKAVPIEKYPNDAGRRPLLQFDACGHLRTPRPGEARFELDVTDQAPEFQRQVVSTTVDLGTQNLQIAHVLAP